MKELTKEDKKYLGGLFFFTIVAALRFFDFIIIPHGGMIASLMENMRFVVVITCTYIVVLFITYGVILKNLSERDRKTGYYLVGFLSVFLNTMFFCKSYFGTMDEYGWILFFIAFHCLLKKRFEWLILVCGFVMTFLYPTNGITLGSLLMALLLYRYETSEKKAKNWMLIANVFAIILGAGSSYFLRGIYLDVQSVMGIKKFIVVLVLFFPYFLMGISYFKSLGNKWKYFVLGLLGVCFETVVGDYGRAIFYGFTYYLIFGIYTLVLQDGQSRLAISDIKKRIKEKLSIPSVVILYPLFIFTIWVCGILTLVEEEFVGL